MFKFDLNNRKVEGKFEQRGRGQYLGQWDLEGGSMGFIEKSKEI